MTRFIALISLISVISLLAACGSGDDGSPAASSTPTSPPVSLDGLVQVNPDNGGRHIPAGQRGAGYTESPATSGQHWFAPDTPIGLPAPARWGVYSVELPDEVLVHNLEHGGIGIHYSCPSGCDELVSQLRSLMPSNPSQLIMSPYPAMESTIAITAWRRSMYLDEFDEAKIRTFIAQFQDQAPESIPGNTF